MGLFSESPSVGKAIKFVTTTDGMIDAAILLPDVVSEEQQTAVITCVADTFEVYQATSSLRKAAVERLSVLEPSPLARMRQTSTPWKLIMATLDSDRSFPAFAKELRHRLARQKKDCFDFLTIVDGRETVVEENLLKATVTILKVVVKIIQSPNSSKWLPGVREVLDLCLAARGEGTEDELSPEVVVSSFFFLRFLCPILLVTSAGAAAKAMKSSVRKRMMVWLSKSVMKGVAATLEGTSATSKGGTSVQGSVRLINTLLLEQNSSGSSVPRAAPSPKTMSVKASARGTGLLQALLQHTTMVKDQLRSNEAAMHKWEDHALELVKVGFEAKFTYTDVWARAQRKGSVPKVPSAHSRSRSSPGAKRRPSVIGTPSPLHKERSFSVLLEEDGSEADLIGRMYQRRFSEDFASTEESLDSSIGPDSDGSNLSLSGSQVRQQDGGIAAAVSRDVFLERKMVLKAVLEGKVKLIRVSIGGLTTARCLQKEVAAAFEVKSVSFDIDMDELLAHDRSLYKVIVTTP